MLIILLWIFIINCVLKTNPCTYNLKDLNGKKIGSYYEKELLLSKLSSCYPEPDSHIRDEIKVVLDLSNYATKKVVEHATGWCISISC